MQHGRKALLLLVAAAALIGCNGGSGGDGEVIGGGGTAVSADFVPDQPSPPPASVALEKGPASSNLITIHVDATGVSDVYGAAFELAFNGSLAEYVGFTPGSFFEQGGTRPTYQVSSPSPGQVVIGVTRNGAVSGVSTTASRPIVNLTFRVKVAGSGAVTLPDAVLYDAQIQPQPLSGITWEAGTLHGN